MKVLALNKDGALTFCTVLPEDRGKGRCNHVAHQAEGQSKKDFIDSISNEILEEKENEVVIDEELPEIEEISQSEIDIIRDRIEEIAGCKVTEDNLIEVLTNLSPEKARQINEIGFEAAPEFSLPISDKDYGKENIDNKLYFSNLPDYGIAGKSKAIEAMFNQVGEVTTVNGRETINGNYREGLDPEDYFKLQFSAMKASISKTVDVAKPGATARKMFYALSDEFVHEDCNGDHSHGILGCSIPGGLCEKCAKTDGVNLKAGTFVGSLVSTNLAEPLTQLALKEIHSAGNSKFDERQIIGNTYNGFRNSPVIEKALTFHTTNERRKAIFEGLKEEHAKNGIKMDDYNLMIMTKKLTSFKREKGTGIRYVGKDECCDIVSIGSLGNFDNPFKAAALGRAYNIFTKPYEGHIAKDAANDLLDL